MIARRGFLAAIGAAFVGGRTALERLLAPAAPQIKAAEIVAMFERMPTYSAARPGVLLDRSRFAAINVVAGESIQFEYEVTFRDDRLVARDDARASA